MKLQYLSKVLLIIIFSLSGCTTVSNKNATQGGIQSDIVQNYPLNSELINLTTTYDDQAKLYEMIVLGRIAVSRRNYKQALKYYLDALNLRADIELAREAIMLSEQLNDRHSSILIAELWVKLQPNALMPWKLIAYYSLADKPLEQTLQAVKKVISLESDTNNQLVYFARLGSTYEHSPAMELFQSLANSYPDNPAIQLAIADIYQQREEWHKALSVTKSVVDSNSDLKVAWTFHGSLLMSSGKKNIAIDWYKAALKQFPKSNDLRNKLGHLLYELDQFANAREQFEQIVNNSTLYQVRKSQVSESQYMIAACYYSEDNYPLSRQYFEPLLRIKRHRNSVLFYLGEMARRDTDFESAIIFYRQIESSRYYQTAHNLVARLLLQQGEYQQAIDYLEQLQPQDKADEVEFKLTRLRIINNQGEIEEAEEYLAEILVQHPDDLDVQLYRLQWMLEKEQANEIVTLLPSILTMLEQPEQKQLILSVASMLQGFGTTNLAIELLNTHIENNDTDFLYMRALIAADIGEIEHAESDLRLIIEIDPEHNDAINALGYTLADANIKLAEAQSLIEKAYSNNPDSAAIIDSMGWVLYRLGKLSESTNYLKKAFEIESSAEIASHLGEVFWKMGENDSAKEILRTAITKSPENKALKRIIKQLNIEFNMDPAKP
ncbi:MAG: tetratricopeptide repeat protein [Gammaproteobacteria bacterium]|nr:tetratricopeptide repeat protein [Gammaproteobacteria bacterium]